MYINGDYKSHPGQGRSTRKLFVHIHNVSCSLLLDNGSDYSLISLNFLRENLPQVKLYPISELKLNTASSKQISIRYAVQLPLQFEDGFGSTTILKWFHVSDEMPISSGLIGADLFYGPSVDSYQKMLIRLKSDKIPGNLVRVPLVHSSVNNNFVYVDFSKERSIKTRITVLPSYKHIEICVSLHCVSNEVKNFKREMIPDPYFLQNNIEFSEFSYDRERHMYTLLCINRSDVDFKFEHGMFVGRLQRIEPHDKEEEAQTMLSSFFIQSQKEHVIQKRQKDLESLENEIDDQCDHESEENDILKWFKKSTPDEAKAKVDLSHLSLSDRQKADNVLDQIKHGFALSAYDVGHFTKFKVPIELKSETPFIQQKKIPFSPKNAQKAKLLFDEFEKLGIISKVRAPKTFVANSSFVIKPGKKIRIVVDGRIFNISCKRRTTSLGGVTDFIKKCAGFTHLSCLDLSNSFFSLEYMENDKNLFNIFGTENDQYYRFNRCIMGWVNSMAWLQAAYGECLKGLEDNAFPYADDCFIGSSGSVDQHLELVLKVAQRIISHGFKIQPAKLELCKTRIMCVGLELTLPNELSLPLEKKELLMNYAAPKTKRQLQKFINVLHYFKQFIPNICRSTPRLLELARQKVPFVFDDTARAQFKDAQRQIADSLTLLIYDPKKTLYLLSDGSRYGLSPFLAQKDMHNELRPIGCYSKPLAGKDTLLSQAKIEIKALYWALKTHFQILSSAVKVVCMCDAKALIFCGLTSSQNSVSYRLSLLLSELQAEVIHTPASEPIMQAVDSFNRCSETLPEYEPLPDLVTEEIVKRMTFKKNKRFSPEEVKDLLDYCQPLPHPAAAALAKKKCQKSRKRLYTRDNLNIKHTDGDASTVRERNALKRAKIIPRNSFMTKVLDDDISALSFYISYKLQF